MSVHRATHDVGSSSSSTTEGQLFTAGPVVLFIGAVLIAGMTCILYLWQQSQIVAGQQQILQLTAQLTQLRQQHSDLVAQEESLGSVTNVIEHAQRYGMTQSTSTSTTYLTLPLPAPTAPMVAQNTGGAQSPVILPATNAAITSWWQNAWDSLYSLLQ
jgi:cell division protein FtsL